MSKIANAIFQYTLKKYGGVALSILLILAFLVALFGYYEPTNIGALRWTQVIDPVISIVALILPVLLTLYFIYQEWTNSLDKKLIVHFTIYQEGKKEYVFSCYNVNLLPGGDMRSLGQQIGSQMGKNTFLHFNPSIKPVRKGLEQIVTKYGERQWIFYYEIEFILFSEVVDKDHPDTHLGRYLVWNNFDEKILSWRTHPRPTLAFHQLPEVKLNLSELLSFDSNSELKFLELGQPKVAASGNPLYVLNASVVTDFGIFSYQSIDFQKAIELMKVQGFVSCIGHEGTAEFLSEATQMTIGVNRQSIRMRQGEQALVFKFRERLEHPRELTKHQLKWEQFEIGLLTCINTFKS